MPNPAHSSPPSSGSSGARLTHSSHTPLSPARHAVQATALSLSTLAQRTHASSTLDFDGDDDYEMVQQYGAAQGHEGRDTQQQHATADDPRNSSEGDALLGAAASARRPKREGHASLTSSTSNLANTIIGSGASFFVDTCLSLYSLDTPYLGMLTFPMVSASSSVRVMHDCRVPYRLSVRPSVTPPSVAFGLHGSQGPHMRTDV